MTLVPSSSAYYPRRRFPWRSIGIALRVLVLWEAMAHLRISRKTLVGELTPRRRCGPVSKPTNPSTLPSRQPDHRARLRTSLFASLLSPIHQTPPLRCARSPSCTTRPGPILAPLRSRVISWLLLNWPTPSNRERSLLMCPRRCLPRYLWRSSLVFVGQADRHLRHLIKQVREAGHGRLTGTSMVPRTTRIPGRCWYTAPPDAAVPGHFARSTLSLTC